MVDPQLKKIQDVLRDRIKKKLPRYSIVYSGNSQRKLLRMFNPLNKKTINIPVQDSSSQTSDQDLF